MALEGPTWAPLASRGLGWCLYPWSSPHRTGQMFVCNAADKEKGFPFPQWHRGRQEQLSFTRSDPFYSFLQWSATVQCTELHSHTLWWISRQQLWLALCIVAIIQRFEDHSWQQKANKGFTLPDLPFWSLHSVLKCTLVKSIHGSVLFGYFYTKVLCLTRLCNLGDSSVLWLKFKVRDGITPPLFLCQTHCFCVTFPAIK